MIVVLWRANIPTFCGGERFVATRADAAAAVIIRVVDAPANLAGQLALWSEQPAEFRLRIRQSTRSRRLCVRVHPDAQVEVVVPRGTSRQHVSRFLVEHEDWIARRLARLPPPRIEAFPPQVLELTAVGERWRVHVAAGRGRTRVQIMAPGLLQLRGALDQADDLRRVLRRWIVERGRDTLTPRVHARATACELAVSAVQVRTQRTRWGSCSHRRVICLNAAVLFQRQRVLDYLIAHELAHLRHMNHSASFWRAVAAMEPDWQTLDRELLRGWERVPVWFRARSTEEA